jgi:hypothetical protein
VNLEGKRPERYLPQPKLKREQLKRCREEIKGGKSIQG